MGLLSVTGLVLAQCASQSPGSAGRLIPCVGAVVHDGDGRILLVRRANEPGRGLWSIPGGRVEPGESAASAVVREVLEETGLAVMVGGYLGSVRRAAPGGGTFVIRDYRAAPVSAASVLAPGDDADDARWVTRAELVQLDVVDGLVEALARWSALPD